MRAYNYIVALIEKPLEMTLAYYFHLGRQDQNDRFRFGALFVTFNKSQIICIRLGDFIFLYTLKM